jgi:hypothetical protein
LHPGIDVTQCDCARIIVRMHETNIATGVGTPYIEVGGYAL